MGMALFQQILIIQMGGFWPKSCSFPTPGINTYSNKQTNREKNPLFVTFSKKALHKYAHQN